MKKLMLIVAVPFILSACSASSSSSGEYNYGRINTKAPTFSFSKSSSHAKSYNAQSSQVTR